MPAAPRCPGAPAAHLSLGPRGRARLGLVVALGVAGACGEAPREVPAAPPAPTAARAAAPPAHVPTLLDAPRFDLEVRPLEVPGLPARFVAFNPGLVAWAGRYVVVFRADEAGRPGHGPRANHLVAMVLNAGLEPTGRWQFLALPVPEGQVQTAEDPRLVAHGGRLWVVYNASGRGAGVGPRQMHLAELRVETEAEPWVFALGADRRLVYAPPGQAERFLEKNWSPFSAPGGLHLLYRHNPPWVLKISDAELDQPAAVVRPALVPPGEQAPIAWPYGPWRGGTPAVFDPELGRYVAFFHNRLLCRLDAMPPRTHYFTGFYTFAAEPPFAIEQVYPTALFTPPFVAQAARHEGPFNVVYAQGLVLDGDDYLVSFGLADRQMALMRFARRQLWAGLVDAVRLREDGRRAEVPAGGAQPAAGPPGLPWLGLLPRPAAPAAGRWP